MTTWPPSTRRSPLVVLLALEQGVHVTAVEIDGVASEWRGPMPVDIGHHTITAHADGRPDVRLECDATTAGPVSVAVVFPVPAAVAVPATGLVVPAPRVVFIGVAGVAAAGVVVGSIFGVLTFSQKSSEAGHCAGNFCDAAGLSAESSAHASATTSTVAFTVGLAAIAVDTVLLVASRRRADRPVALAVTF